MIAALLSTWVLIPIYKSPFTHHYNGKMTPLAWCVSGLESNHEFHIDTGNGYYGGYQFSYTTWLNVQTMMGVYYASRADLATRKQQTAVFNYYEPKNRLAWPQTVPACGG